MPSIEFRHNEDVVIEFRAGTDADPVAYAEGLGVIYNKESEIYPGYMESVRAGAFGKLASKEVKSFFNHDASQVLSTTESSPRLKLDECDDGLYFRSPIPPTSYGKNLEVNLQCRNVRGASFTFTVTEDVITIDEKDVYHREIVKAELYEIGPVTNPAYTKTNVALRSMDDVVADIKERCKPEEQDIRANEMLIRKRSLDLL